MNEKDEGRLTEGIEDNINGLGRRSLVKIITGVILYFLLIPLFIAIGVLFGDRSYNLIAACVMLAACAPFFIFFEKKQKTSRELVVIAVMSGVSVLGRFIFAPIPGFKPVTAIVIISAIYLGKDAGFMIGALSAFVSNMYFGQGPWTPFQMFSWGTMGYLCGVAAKAGLFKKWWALVVAAIFGGIVFSLLMDVWSTLALEGGFSVKLYLAKVITSLPYMAIYFMSNLIFLLLLTKPIGEKLKRITTKFDIF